MVKSKLADWLRRQVVGFMVATGKVAENALNQEGQSLGEETKMQQRVKQGTLSDDLMRGELTQQVMELRWRMYAVVEAAQSKNVVFKGYMKDDDGNEIVIDGERVPLYETFEIDPTIVKAKGDPYDDYEIEMVVDNTVITRGKMDDGSIDDVKIDDKTQKELENIKEDVEEGKNTEYKIMYDSRTGEEVLVPKNITSAKDFHEAEERKNEYPVLVWREYRTKFELEKFTEKLYIRKIDEKHRLLEFYVSKYPNQDDRKTHLFVSEVKKAMKNPRVADFTDINEVGFITYKTVGCKDFREFQYKVLGVDKIVEHEGYYIVKFKAEVLVDGVYIMEKYKEGAEELIQKYENKEKREGEADNTYTQGFEDA